MADLHRQNSSTGAQADDHEFEVHEWKAALLQRAEAAEAAAEEEARRLEQLAETARNEYNQIRGVRREAAGSLLRTDAEAEAPFARMTRNTNVISNIVPINDMVKNEMASRWKAGERARAAAEATAAAAAAEAAARAEAAMEVAVGVAERARQAARVARVRAIMARRWADKSLQQDPLGTSLTELDPELLEIVDTKTWRQRRAGGNWGVLGPNVTTFMEPLPSGPSGPSREGGGGVAAYQRVRKKSKKRRKRRKTKSRKRRSHHRKSRK